jgi:hypothetical protein
MNDSTGKFCLDKWTRSLVTSLNWSKSNGYTVKDVALTTIATVQDTVQSGLTKTQDTLQSGLDAAQDAWAENVKHASGPGTDPGHATKRA